MAESSSSSIDQATPFQRAFDEYIKGIPEKKQKRKFIVDCQRSANGPITPEAIHDSIKSAEEKSSKQTSKRIIRNVLGPVVHVLNDYGNIIGTLVSANPIPTAIIWGALKVIIDGADRYLNLFETIKNELRSLTSYLQRITEYEWLYGDSPLLQELLYKSYINILRFWSRVDKECERCAFNSLFRAAASFSTDKLRKIVDDLKGDADEIQKLAPIIEARKAKGEREDAELERGEARLQRLVAQQDRQTSAAWREQQQVDRQAELYRQVCNWLCSQRANEDNQRRLRINTAQRFNGTCDWLLLHPNYLTWLNGDTKPSIIWLRAHPGCGKSTLCSHVIHSVEESDPTAATAFHFYRFDHEHSAIETLRLLADQLFEKYWNCSHLVSEEINLQTQKTSSSLVNVRDLIEILVKSLPKTYFILDGLDEECAVGRWAEAETVLDFLVHLSLTFPESVRLWYSSQDRPCIHKKLCTFIVFDIKDQVRNDVTYYLSRQIPELDVPEVSEEQAGILEHLKEKAEGNFLWASLMVKAITEEASSLREMKQFVKEGLPLTLDDYYRRIFERIEKNERSLASKIFAIIAFARRPLRVKELREAIGILQSSNPRSPDGADLPFARSLRKLFAPLIEIQSSSDDADDCTCYLFHSTVRDFLFKYPEILNNGTGGLSLRISSQVIFNACLLYLSQTRFQKLLVRRDARWVDASGVCAESFLVYSAKYWDKHLDDVPETDALRTRVQSFLTSPNFLTCIQAQSLWVDRQFSIFFVTGQPETNTYVRRVFPTRFAGHREHRKLWKDFRAFLHEWRYFLQCGSCENPTCRLLPYAGEVDRCFWQALGSRNFMSGFEGRYTSFTFQSEEVVDNSSSQCYEGISVSGDELRLLKLVTRSQGRLEFVCEHWYLAGNALPVLRKKQSISTEETSTNWLFYVKYSGTEANMRAGRASPISFSSDCQLLRIGSEIFAQNAQGDYMSLLGSTTIGDYHPSYIEEFTGRGPFVVVASRRAVTKDDIYESGIRDAKVIGFGTDFIKMEATSPEQIDFDEIDINEDDADDESSYGSSTGSSSHGHETWSECSTDEADVQFEDDLITPWTGRVESLGKSSSESSDTSFSDDGEESKAEGNSSESESDLSPSAIINYGRYRGDTSSDDNWGANNISSGPDDSDEDEYAAHAYNPHRDKASIEPHASVTVFDTSSVPTKIFRFTRTLPFILYGSPPVIHPSESLLVWPLSGGDVLFADFLAKTFFVRKLRPSTAHTRHIFMKCRFSPCGRYLHVVSLEGQRKPVVRHGRNKTATKLPLNLALLVSTYRLSGSKATKSPPSLIYLTRINLGTVKSLSVSRLPFALTWTPEELFFTRSDVTLRLYRIRLFRLNSDKNTTPHGLDVSVPQKDIFLPNTARRRKVYYFPPEPGSSDSRVIIGCEARESESMNVGDKFFEPETEPSLCATDDVIGLCGMLSLPIGCYLKEADLGEWVKSNDLSEIPHDLGVGRLDRRLERFNPDDDCDLEPYIF